VEANAELEKIAPELRAHPDVLEVRWTIYANARNWEPCVDIADAIIKLAPDPRRGCGVRNLLGTCSNAFTRKNYTTKGVFYCLAAPILIRIYLAGRWVINHSAG
jgi:hypothetical protein